MIALSFGALSSFFFNDADERSRSFAGPQGNSAISGFVFFFSEENKRASLCRCFFCLSHFAERETLFFMSVFFSSC